MSGTYDIIKGTLDSLSRMSESELKDLDLLAHGVVTPNKNACKHKWKEKAALENCTIFECKKCGQKQLDYPQKHIQ